MGTIAKQRMHKEFRLFHIREEIIRFEKKLTLHFVQVIKSIQI